MTAVIVLGRERLQIETMVTGRTGLTMLRLASERSEPGKVPVAVFRPFFLAGIATVLTVGCLLGALALHGIARQGSYTQTAWTPYVLAHANSQLYGWVGFFVMGFTIQQHGASARSLPSLTRLANWCLWLMAGGIVLRFVAEPLAQADPARWVWLGVASSVLQIAAIGAMVLNIAKNRDPSRPSSGWPLLFVTTSLLFWAVVALADPFVFVGTHQADTSASIAFVARWATPLREAQFLGFVATMVFGVAASKFPGCLGFREAKRTWGLLAYGAWVLGLALRITGWIAYFNAGLTPGSDTVFRLGAAFLGLGAVCMIVSLGVLESVLRPNASQKFLKAGFVWLLVAASLASFERLHLSVIGEPFSHAYTGAIRHALTVGFISQMILGVGYHVATRMTGSAEIGARALWAAWWLLNLGNLGRVGLEVATDYFPGAFAPMGATGFIELVGLVCWASVMARLLLPRSEPVAATC